MLHPSRVALLAVSVPPCKTGKHHNYLRLRASKNKWCTSRSFLGDFSCNPVSTDLRILCMESLDEF